MLQRTQTDPEEGAESTVLVTATLAQGFEAIANTLRPAPGRCSALVVDVVGDPKVVTCDLPLLNTAGVTHVQLRPADRAPFYSGQPRAAVTAVGMTWNVGSGGAVYDERLVEMSWYVQACPKGVDPAVHEISETLAWDADDRGEHLDEAEARALAQAIANGR